MFLLEQPNSSPQIYDLTPTVPLDFHETLSLIFFLCSGSVPFSIKSTTKGLLYITLFNPSFLKLVISTYNSISFTPSHSWTIL